MRLQIINDLDFLYRERIEILLNQGYFGYTIQDVSTDDYDKSVIAKAKNKKGDSLHSKGKTLVDACQQMISLIDTTTDDF